MTAWHRQAIGDTAAWPRRWPAANDPVFVIASAAAATISVAWMFGWAMVLVRRAAGGFAASPGNVMPWGTVLVGLAVAAMIDVARRAGMAPAWTGLPARAGTILAALAVMPVATTVSERVASLIPLGIAIGGSLVAPLVRNRDGWLGGRASKDAIRKSPFPTATRDVLAAVPPSPPRPAGFRQRIERYQSANDGDRAIGRVIVDVPTGSRTGHAHIGFCPPFVAMPTVEVMSDDDGVEAVVTAAEIVPWGVRVECRLSEPAEESLAIPVDILARYPG